MSPARATSRRGFLRTALASLAAGAWLGRGTAAAGAEDPGAVNGVQPILGEIRLFAGATPPSGWAFCEGQLLSIAQYETLFYVIGTTYGGDGEFTYALPDLRGRVPIHRGPSPFGSSYDVGDTGGLNEVTLTASELPAHTHGFAASTSAGDSDRPAGRVPARDASGTPRYAAAADTNLAAAAIDSAGGSQPHENRQPFVALHFMIALEGVFPQQN